VAAAGAVDGKDDDVKWSRRNYGVVPSSPNRLRHARPTNYRLNEYRPVNHVHERAIIRNFRFRGTRMRDYRVAEAPFYGEMKRSQTPVVSE